MDFPFGHHGHHRRDEDEDEAPRFPPTGSYNPYPPRPEFDAPPPPFTDNIHGGPPGYPPAQHRPNYDAPPPSQFGENVYGAPGYPPAQHRPNYDSPPPPQFGENVYGAPGFPPAQHGYDAPPQPSFGHGFQEAPQQHHHRLPFSSHPVEHVGHESWGGGGGAGSGIPQQTVRVFTKAKEDFALSIREGTVVLAPANPRDEYQHWIKDMRYSTKVKDEEGLPSFALVNKVTGEAIKHAIKATHPVRLVPYKPDYLDESILWTESKDTGENFRCIRMVNNIQLNFDAFHGDEYSGGVHDGTAVVLWEWKKGKNQRWKIVPY